MYKINDTIMIRREYGIQEVTIWAIGSNYLEVKWEDENGIRFGKSIRIDDIVAPIYKRNQFWCPGFKGIIFIILVLLFAIDVVEEYFENNKVIVLFLINDSSLIYL